MKQIPPEVLLSWPEPNYENPETRANSIIVSASICIPAMVLIFAARMYSRLHVAKYFGLDDWLIIPSIISGLAYSSIKLTGIKSGWYIHTWNVPLPTLVGARKLVIAADFTGLLNVGFTKLSVLALYTRLAPPSRFQTAVFVLMGVTSAWMISMGITTFLMCMPLHAYWEVGYEGPQRCLDEVPYFVAFSSIDILLDTIIYLLPLPIVFRLRMPGRQRLILLGVFGIGILAIAAAALRLPSLVRVSKSFDLTWEIYDSVIWTEAEAVVGMFCASVPSLKPLVLRYAPKALGSLTRSSPTTIQPSRLAGMDPRSPSKPQSGSDVVLELNGYDSLDDVGVKPVEARRGYV